MRKSPSRRSWRGAAIVLAAVAVLGVGYAVAHFVRTASSTPLAEPAPPAHAVAPVAPPAPRAEPVVAPAPSKAAAPPATKPAPQRVIPKRPAESTPEPPPAPAVARFASATEPPAPPPEPAPEPRPAPPRDRWQLMNDAIAQCGRESFFAGVVCEQRVRLQYCDGHWGQVPQCPNGIPNDHGD